MSLSFALPIRFLALLPIDAAETPAEMIACRCGGRRAARFHTPLRNARGQSKSRDGAPPAIERRFRSRSARPGAAAY